MKNITVRKAEIDDVAGLSELFVDFIGKESNLTAMKKQIVSEGKREFSHKFYESIGYSTDQRGFKKRLMKQM